MSEEVSTFRLYVLRFTYLLIAVGLGFMVWPRLVDHTNAWALKNGDTFGLLAGIQVLSVLGIRYPLKMLPLLLFELTWKSIWLVAIAFPLWRAGAIDPGTAESIKACGMGVIISAAAIPWTYFLVHYVKRPGDRWRGAPRPSVAGAPLVLAALMGAGTLGFSMIVQPILRA